MRYPTIVASWLKGGFLEPNVGYAVRPHEKVAILVAAVNFVCHCLADWVWYLVLLTLVAERFLPPTWLSCSLATPALFVEILEFLAVVLTEYGDYTCGSWW